REGELLLDDALIQDEPRIVGSTLRNVLECAEAVKAWIQWRRQGLAVGVEPKRRGTRKNSNGVFGPDRTMVLDCLRVMPHSVPVDVRGTSRLGNREHGPVHIVRHPLKHSGRRPAHATRLGRIAEQRALLATRPGCMDTSANRSL